MAQLILTIDSSIATDVRDTLCTRWGYSGNPADLAAKLEFVRQRLIAHSIDEYSAQKGIEASEAARLIAMNNAKQISIT